MITDSQWDTFARHIKPNCTIRWGAQGEGYLIENFPYDSDNDRIEVNRGVVIFYGHTMRPDGRLKAESMDEVRIQLCDKPHTEWVDPVDLEYWYEGEFITFDQIMTMDVSA